MVQRRGKLAIYATNSGVQLAEGICRELERYARERRDLLTGRPLSFDERDEQGGIERLLEHVEEEREIRGEKKRVIAGDTILKEREIRTFSDSEVNVIVEESVRGRDCYVVTCPYEPPSVALKGADALLSEMLRSGTEREVQEILQRRGKAEEKLARIQQCYENAWKAGKVREVLAQLANGRTISENIMEALILVDTLEHAGHRTLVAPYDAFARQDVQRERESLTVALMAKLWKAAGVNHKIVMDVHSRQKAGAYRAVGLHFDNLYSTSLLLRILQQQYGEHLEKFSLLGPDAGIGKTIAYYAKRLGIQAFGIGVKVRDYDHPDTITQKTIIVGEVGEYNAIFDDMIASGGTMEAMIEPVLKQTRNPVTIIAVHPLFTGDAVERFDRLYREEKISGVWVVGTIKRNQIFQDQHPWYHEIAPERLLAQTIYHLNMNLPVPDVYQKA